MIIFNPANSWYCTMSQPARHSPLPAEVIRLKFPADCSQKKCDPGQLAVKSNPTGITSPVTAVSWDHKPCGCSQL